MIDGAQRVDKWLWHARLIGSRSGAKRLILAGHVRINREKATAASQLVRPGDIVVLALARAVKALRVVGIAERRVSAADTPRLYTVALTERDAAARSCTLD